MADLKPVTLCMTNRQINMLKEEANRLGIVYSEMVRRILDEHLSRKEKDSK